MRAKAGILRAPADFLPTNIANDQTTDIMKLLFDGVTLENVN